MATISQRGPHQWRVQIRKKSLVVPSRTFESYKEAATWAARIEGRISEGTFVDATPMVRTTVADLFNAYKKARLPNLKGQTQTESRLNAWERRLGSTRSLASITYLDFLEFAEDRLDDDIEPATIRRDLADAQAAMKFARVVLRLPVPEHLFQAALYGLPKSASRARRLPRKEEKALLKKARKYSADAFSLILLDLETGMRRGEISSLCWEDVHLSAVPEECHIFLPADRTKNGTERIIPLSDTAIRLLRKRPRGIGKARIFPSITKADSVTQLFSRVRERAGLEDLRFHDLRHEAASRIAPRVPMVTLQAIMGWRSISMAQRYYNPVAKELGTAIRNAPAKAVNG